MLYGLERFGQYTYDRKVTIHNDHKPIETILNEPLAMAPKRLQDIMMRWNRYDFDFVYVKGLQKHSAEVDDEMQTLKG